MTALGGLDAEVPTVGDGVEPHVIQVDREVLVTGYPLIRGRHDRALRALSDQRFSRFWGGTTMKNVYMLLVVLCQSYTGMV